MVRQSRAGFLNARSKKAKASTKFTLYYMRSYCLVPEKSFLGKEDSVLFILTNAEGELNFVL